MEKQEKKLTPEEMIAKLEEVLEILERKRRTFQGIKEEVLKSGKSQ